MKQLQEKWEKWFANKKNASKLVIYLGLLGMALILISELWGASEGSVVENANAGQFSVSSDSTELTTMVISIEERYRKNLEETLSALIEQMDGAGETVVMITLSTSEEVVYAKDVTQGETQLSESHVVLKDGDALSEMTYTPIVRGVAVLCEGGDQVMVEAAITSMITALFDISSNHVVVEKLR